MSVGRGTEETVTEFWMRKAREDWAQPYIDALTAIAVTPCREWVPEEHDNCKASAEFILWGKLIPAEGLGPRCYDHAVKHVPPYALGDPAWAIVDLRPARRLLGLDPS